jgi:hypothetical protein
MMDRRLFLKTAFLTSVFPFQLLGKEWEKKMLYLLGVSSNTSPASHFLWGWDIKSNQQFLIPVGFKIHSIIPSPNKDEVSVIGQWEYEITRINLSQKKVILSKKIGIEKTKYVGHGFYDHSGEHLYTTVANYQSNDKSGAGTGEIFKYSLKDLNLLEKIPSHGEEPHDILPISKDRALVLNAGMGQAKSPKACPSSNASIINYLTGELIKKWDFKEKRYFMAHGTQIEQDSFVLVGGKYSNSGIISPMALKLLTPLDEFEITKDQGKTPFLSIATFNNLVIATHPETGKLICWDLDSKKLVKMLTLGKMIFGISFFSDGTYFLANSEEAVFLINSKSFSIEKKIKPKNLLMDGSHSILI